MPKATVVQGQQSHHLEMGWAHTCLAGAQGRLEEPGREWHPRACAHREAEAVTGTSCKSYTRQGLRMQGWAATC